MSILSTLVTGLALKGVERLTAPEPPSAADVPSFDFTGETADALAARRATEDPQFRALIAQQTKTALSLSRGELPKEIEQNIRRVAAENTTMRGLSAEQGTRLTARAIGKSQTEIMRQGAELTQLVDNIRVAEWTTAADSAISKANNAFTRFANRERYRLAAWETQAKSHASLFSGLISSVATATTPRSSRSPVTGRRALLRDLDAQDWWGGQAIYDSL